MLFLTTMTSRMVAVVSLSRPRLSASSVRNRLSEPSSLPSTRIRSAATANADFLKRGGSARAATSTTSDVPRRSISCLSRSIWRLTTSPDLCRNRRVDQMR